MIQVSILLHEPLVYQHSISSGFYIGILTQCMKYMRSILAVIPPWVCTCPCRRHPSPAHAPLRFPHMIPPAPAPLQQRETGVHYTLTTGGEVGEHNRRSCRSWRSITSRQGMNHMGSLDVGRTSGIGSESPESLESSSDGATAAIGASGFARFLLPVTPSTAPHSLLPQ